MKMTKKDKQELKRLQDEIIKEAKKVVEDYIKTPSEMRGVLILLLRFQI